MNCASGDCDYAPAHKSPVLRCANGRGVDSGEREHSCDFPNCSRSSKGKEDGASTWEISGGREGPKSQDPDHEGQLKTTRAVRGQGSGRGSGRGGRARRRWGWCTTPFVKTASPDPGVDHPELHLNPLRRPSQPASVIASKLRTPGAQPVNWPPTPCVRPTLTVPLRHLRRTAA